MLEEKKQFQTDETFIALLDGERCSNKVKLFQELSEALIFPEYFGHNWDALRDVLLDLEWISQENIILLFTHGDKVLSEESASKVILLEILEESKKELEEFDVKLGWYFHL